MVVNYKINYIIKKRLLIDVLTLYNIFLLITKPFDDLHEESILANAVIRVGSSIVASSWSESPNFWTPYGHSICSCLEKTRYHKTAPALEHIPTTRAPVSLW